MLFVMHHAVDDDDDKDQRPSRNDLPNNMLYMFNPKRRHHHLTLYTVLALLLVFLYDYVYVLPAGCLSRCAGSCSCEFVNAARELLSRARFPHSSLCIANYTLLCALTHFPPDPLFWRTLLAKRTNTNTHTHNDEHTHLGSVNRKQTPKTSSEDSITAVPHSLVVRRPPTQPHHCCHRCHCSGRPSLRPLSLQMVLRSTPPPLRFGSLSMASATATALLSLRPPPPPDRSLSIRRHQHTVASPPSCGWT